MNWVDLVILVGLGLGVARGFSTGAVRQIANIVGVFVAFALGVQLMHEVGTLLVESLPVSEQVAPLVGFMLVFLAVQVVFHALVRIAESLLDALRLTLANRLAGGACGAFLAALVLSLGFLVADPLGWPDRQDRRGAALYAPVAAVLPGTWDYAAARLPQLRRLSGTFGQRVEDGLFDAER